MRVSWRRPWPHGEDCYAAVCLAGEAGLRVGEVKALRWRENVDMIARTLTVNQQSATPAITTSASFAGQASSCGYDGTARCRR